MDRPHLLSEQRKTSFNPEAVTFSPTFDVATPDLMEPARSPPATSESIPRELYDRLVARHNDLLSQLREKSSILESREREPTIVSTPVVDPHNVSSQHLDVRAAPQMGQEQTVLSGIRAQYNQALQTHAMSGLMVRTSPSALQPQGPEPNLDELNASLGLPGLKTDDAIGGPSIQSRLSRSPPEIPSVYGKLIGRALDKPLTANGLAQYLNTINHTSSDNRATYPNTSVDPTMPKRPGSFMHTKEQNLKAATPLLGFNRIPHDTAYIEQSKSNFSPMKEPQHAPISPTVHQSPQSVRSTRRGHQHFPDFLRGSPSKKRSRAPTRPKRTDQGPEPSAADIYPDDAQWGRTASPEMLRRLSVREPFVPRLSRMPEEFIDDTSIWPTPAEVYKQKPAPSLPASRPDPVEEAKAPTAADMCDGDDDVLALVDSLRHITTDNLQHYGAMATVCDERPLTLNQQDGRVYGLKHHGLGLGRLGDDWNPEMTRDRQLSGLGLEYKPHGKW